MSSSSRAASRSSKSLPGRVAAFQISEVRPQVSGVILRRLFARRLGRPAGPDALPDRSQHLSGAGRAGRGQSPERAGQRRGRAGPGRALQAAGRNGGGVASRIIPTRWPRRARPMPRSPRTMPRSGPRRSTCATPASPRRSAAGSACPTVTEGALVTANQAEALTTITRLDPIYVDIQQSAPDLLALRRSLASGGAVPTTAQVRLKLPDGSDYGYTGTVEFTEVVVNADTGIGDASRPLPQSAVDPAARHVRDRAASPRRSTRRPILVPQQAISRDPKGNATLWVVGPGNTRRAADRRRRSHRRAKLGRDPGPRRRRKGHHPGRRQSEGRRARSSRCRPARRSGPSAAAGAGRTARRSLSPCRASSSIARSSPG